MAVVAGTVEKDEFAGVTAVALDGVTLAYREVGSGDPVVFVHGSVSDLRTWEQQLPVIGRSHRAIAYSRRYARPNADIPAGVDDDMLVHVADLAGFLRAVGAAPAHLVGNSWGAFICLLTAIRHPGLVRSLALEEPPLIPLVLGAGARPRPGTVLANLVRRPQVTMPVLAFGARTIAPVQKAFRAGEDEQATERFVTGVLGRGAYEGLPARRKAQMRENVRALKAQMLGDGFPPLSPEEVRGVTVPALLLTGEQSPSLFGRLTDLLGQLLPAAESVRIPGASHVMHEENANVVNEALLRFLRAQR